MAPRSTLPALVEDGLSGYIAQVRKFPMLTPEEEYTLAKALKDHGDVEAAHKLVTSHLRLVVKMAMEFRGYGLSMVDMISEGNIGLMQAVKKFEPEKGFRLATYAMWWIKASITEFVLRSWSMVKMGSSAAQKKLFFGLRRERKRILGLEDRDLSPQEVKQLALDMNVPERDVMEMDQRLRAHDSSLNVAMGEDGDAERMDYLQDTRPTHDIVIAETQETRLRRAMVREALATLNDRERDIVEQRMLHEPPITLEELSGKYGVSRERIRQLEGRAFEKIQQFVLAKSNIPALPTSAKLLSAT